MAGDQWFDNLARGLARSGSRRAALQRVGTVLAGTVFAAALPARAEAIHKSGHTRGCKGGCPSPESRCCRGTCVVISFDRFNCGACGNVCPTGHDCCGGRCVNVSGDDPSNCGCCGCGCLSGQEVCVNGQCVEA